MIQLCLSYSSDEAEAPDPKYATYRQTGSFGMVAGHKVSFLMDTAAVSSLLTFFKGPLQPSEGVIEGVLVKFSHSVVSDSLPPHEPQDARLPCPPPTPGVPQTHVHQVSDAIQPSHPLLSPSPPALNLSQNQGLF